MGLLLGIFAFGLAFWCAAVLLNGITRLVCSWLDERHATRRLVMSNNRARRSNRLR